MIAHGYQPRDPDDVRFATEVRARVREDVQAATYSRAEPPAWLPEMKALAAA